jgi:hypothetical protein
MFALAACAGLGACSSDADEPRDTIDGIDTLAPDVDDTADTFAPDVDDTTPRDTADTEVIAVTPTWDPTPTGRQDCAPGRSAPLMDALLAQAGLTRETFTFSADDYAGSAYFARGDLDDAFLHPDFRALQAAPLDAGCFTERVAAAMDSLAVGAHPIAALIRHAGLHKQQFEGGPEASPTAPRLAAVTSAESPRLRLAAAIEAAVASATSEPFALPANALAPVPEPLADALVEVFVAMAHALEAHRALAGTAPYMPLKAWVEEGGVGLVPAARFAIVRNDAAREHLEGRYTLPTLNLAAARLAYAIESVDWSRFRGLAGLHLDLDTPVGRIVMRDAAADTYPASDTPTWFLLDTGGDDVHRDDVGATTDGKAGVAVALDLGGDDDYGYDAHDEGGRATDEDGRFPAGDPATADGPVTRSRHGRQGSGRHGIGMLIDLGGGRDRYASLAASQGYAHLGVGVLFDDGGDDTYVSEVASQGAAAFGIGLLIDLAGRDHYTVVHAGQGMAGAAGFGALFDAQGDDTYEADPGPIAAADPSLAPQPLYFSPQTPGQANSSMAQGASTGIRWDAAALFMSGGLGILRDARGDDTYLAALFAQGSGYWQGIGLLSDGDGQDRYDALYYVQGAGAHYAMGLLMDGGAGGDWFNQTLAPMYVQLGSGHDFSLGVFVDEAGDSVYHFAGLAAGASNCNGLGLFVDNGGDDTYTTPSDYGSGLGNVSDECAAARPLPKSVGLMLDAGGVDTYAYPDSTFAVPTDGGTWGHVTHALPSEHGAGADDLGESGVHAP